MHIDIKSRHLEEVLVLNPMEEVSTSLTKIHDQDDQVIYEFNVTAREAFYPKPITLQWKIPALNVMGVWKPTTDFSKRIQADWELEHMESRISIDAPIINLFGHDDSNILTFACSNTINKLEMNARLREEDNCFYCHITFFSECTYAMKNFSAQLYLDYSEGHFSKALGNVSRWWESFTDLKPTRVPAVAKIPLYSTWYQFHQNLDLDLLTKECELAVELGYKVIIIDDGWQTNDNNRGYDYTGDWQPERIPEMASYVEKLHGIGMKVALWYSVPFCGKKSKAYTKFKGKFLTEQHRWAPVFDPRFPDVREYLINTYASALKDWKLDGFKLDFIDDFKWYPDTPLKQEDGRDYASINRAVDRLLTDVMATLQEINPEVFIEFRQKYTGPAMRKYGNMFRAFDCPGDPTMNRIRIADIRMLCGTTAVHSDMLNWHDDEQLEIAALQMTNTLFGVPQMSMMLNEARESHLQMIRFYTKYWNEHSDILMNGSFTPFRPLANYPLKKVEHGNTSIIGVYDNYTILLSKSKEQIHIINSKLGNNVIVDCSTDMGRYHAHVQDCTGKTIFEGPIDLIKGIQKLDVPPCGLVRFKRINT
ncbi:MAG: glycoside hydrolase family 36 protein [Flavobacteriaceae bacterium]